MWNKLGLSPTLLIDEMPVSGSKANETEEHRTTASDSTELAEVLFRG
jgi:hypothetical protein